MSIQIQSTTQISDCLNLVFVKYSNGMFRVQCKKLGEEFPGEFFCNICKAKQHKEVTYVTDARH